MSDTVVSSVNVNPAGSRCSVWWRCFGGFASEHQINLARRKPKLYVNEQLSFKSTLSSLSRI